MDYIIEKFKHAKGKGKFIFILVAVIFVFIALGRLGGSTDSPVAETPTTAPTITSAQTSAPETTVSETTAETTTEATTLETTTVAKARTGIDPDFKAFWDSYESFIDSYVKIMKDPSALYSFEYLNMVAEYADWAAKVDGYDESDLTEEEVKYMNDVTARVTSKMVGIAVAE